MKNPLRKRLLRELKNDIGKYLVIFLFMTATIGFVSGFLVADESMLYAYDESFEKYNVENGNFTTEQKLTDNQRTRLEKEKVTIYENFYKDEDADTDLDSEPESTIRLFKNRTEVNLVCLMKGEMPQQKDEIAIDRMYANNNDLQVVDVISVDKKELTVTGLVALSDYSALFSNSSDMMFDAVKFGVGIMTEEGYDAITDDHIKYCYSWKYDTEPKDENEEKEWSDDFVEVLAAHSSLTGYLPRYGNQAIKFTGDDMGGDGGGTAVHPDCHHGVYFCSYDKQYDCKRSVGDRNAARIRLYETGTSAALSVPAGTDYDFVGGDWKYSGIHRV